MKIKVSSSYSKVLITVPALLVGIISYYKWAFQHWEKKRVPYVTPKFPFGTMNNPFLEMESMGDRTRRQYREFKHLGVKHVGLFNFVNPVYMPIDREYIRNILVKDFDHFVDRGVSYNDENDLSSANLFFAESGTWKILRAKLENILTANNTQMAFPTLLKCGNELTKAIDEIIVERKTVDIKAILDRHVIDIIFTTIFGLDGSTFANLYSDIIRNVKDIFMPTKIEQLQGLMFSISPKLAKLIGFRFVPKGPEDFFVSLIKETMKSREETKTERNDILQVFMDISKKTDNYGNGHSLQGPNLSNDELIAQLLLFLIAGYETLTTSMAFCLFELSLNEEIQQRLREEIYSVLNKHQGAISYEAVIEMVYMDQVLKETMRKYPPVPILNRKCVVPYTIPGTSIVIEKGTDVVIPVIGLHHDAELFPDPGKFDPERFGDKSTNEKEPFAYMPFGEGPRKCLGVHFAVIQMKLALTVLLRNYIFSINSKTQIPLKISPFNIVLTSTGKIWLDIKKL